MKAPFLRDAAHSPNFPQTTILCHSFAPDAEPNRRGQESGHRTARAGSYRSDFKGRTDGSTPTEPVASGLSAAKTHEALYREFRRHSGCRLGKIVRRDGTSAVRLPRSTDGPTRTAHLTETPRRPGADRMIISAKRDRFEKTNHLAVPARSRASMISRNVVQSPWASNSGRRRCRPCVDFNFLPRADSILHGNLDANCVGLFHVQTGFGSRYFLAPVEKRMPPLMTSAPSWLFTLSD
jgi:hypothetical protein